MSSFNPKFPMTLFWFLGGEDLAVAFKFVTSDFVASNLGDMIYHI